MANWPKLKRSERIGLGGLGIGVGVWAALFFWAGWHSWWAVVVACVVAGAMLSAMTEDAAQRTIIDHLPQDEKKTRP